MQDKTNAPAHIETQVDELMREIDHAVQHAFNDVAPVKTMAKIRERLHFLLAGQCLHQIQEPAAAEQAAWHAGLDEGRAQAVGQELKAQHSTACLYGYALSRLGLTDTPQMRILFWDAQEALEWDEKTDRYVTPSAEGECSQCGHIQEPAHVQTNEVTPIVVPDDMPSTEANTKYGESYGVDWVYAGKKAATAAVGVPDERAAFERELIDNHHYVSSDFSFKDGFYGGDDDYIQFGWDVWQARAALAATPAAAPDMVSVKQVDANNYCRILAALGMEEEGDPVAEVQNMLAAAAAPVVTTIPDAAYCALQYVEHSLAAIANREELVGDSIERMDTIAKASKRAKAALTRLQAVAHHFHTIEESQAAAPVVLPEPDAWRESLSALVAQVDAGNSADYRALQEHRIMRSARALLAQKLAIMPKGESAAAQLRAMATNYPSGHSWDKLDAKACIRGALEIEALRAQLATATGLPAQAADALTEIVGCIDAANAEGLDDALVNNTDARLADLVQRRLLPAFYTAIAAQAGQPAAPQAQADARDAERYRWLRDQPMESKSGFLDVENWPDGSFGSGTSIRGKELDSSIDAAISAQSAQGEV